jgi:hypothetical protein
LTLAENLKIAASLSFPTAPDTLRRIGLALQEAKADHTLVGGLAVGALSGKPRATVDVDLVMWQDDVERFLEALWEEFGEREVVRYRKLLRVAEPAIDVIVANGNSLREQTMSEGLRQPIDYDGVGLLIPTLESAMVLKYAAIVSRDRSAEDALQDIADLGRLVASRPDVETEDVVRLARPLRTRSPKEVARVMERLKAGRSFEADRRGSKVQIRFADP